ncbi:MAG: phosphomevalonate kinase, partial [Microbacterium sp.]
RVLQRLGASAGISIETEQLRALCDIAEQHGAAGKPSGAGGGDCGIVIADEGSQVIGIEDEWRQQGIRRLPVAVHAASPMTTTLPVQTARRDSDGVDER